MRLFNTAIALSCLAVPSFAQELTPETAAQIEHQQKKAAEEIDKRHGNKKTSEMSADERRQVIAERAAAEREALEKNGVSAKDYARYSGRQTPQEQAAQKKKEDELEKKSRSAGAPKPAPEVVVQKGISDRNPVVLEERTGGPVQVERGLPPEAQDDLATAEGLSEAKAAAAKPSKAKKKR